MADLKPTVLLVKDEKQIRCLVRTALQDLDWMVREAETVTAGVSTASTRNLENRRLAYLPWPDQFRLGR